MKTIKDDISEIAAAAKVRDQRLFEEAAAQLSDAHRPFVAAHAAFAYLHMALVMSATGLVAEGYTGASCAYSGAEIHFSLPPRQVSCRYFLHETHIEVVFLHGNGQGWHKQWQPPMTVEGPVLLEAARMQAKEAARFLTGLTEHP